MHTNDDACTEALLQMLKTDCISLFEHYGCAIFHTENMGIEIEDSPVSMIDAGSNEMELSLTLRIPHAVLSLSYPCHDILNDISEEQLEDWAMELANQLMGKLKNRLVSQQIYLKLGLPEAYFDIEDATPFGSDAMAQQLYFSVDGIPFACSLAYDIKDPHWQPSLQFVPDTQESFGGEIELF